MTSATFLQRDFLRTCVSPKSRRRRGIDLFYYLQSKLKLVDINFAGNKKYSNRKLSKKLTSKLGEPVDERKLFMDSLEIKKMYQKSGYPQTEVKYVQHPDERGGRATVTFEITESPKIKIEDVYFEGAYAFPQRKLRKQIKTRRNWMFSWLTGSGVLKDDQMADDKEKLAEFYRNAGYIDFELKDVQYLYETPRKVVVNFVISEGRRYRVGAIDFKGVDPFQHELHPEQAEDASGNDLHAKAPAKGCRGHRRSLWGEGAYR